jgi:hypothetical protein
VGRGFHLLSATSGIAEILSLFCLSLPFMSLLSFKDKRMKKRWLKYVFFFLMLLTSVTASNAQCSICTKTASQLGEKPAKALNKGILYLMFMPMAICGFIGYRWYKANRDI